MRHFSDLNMVMLPSTGINMAGEYSAICISSARASSPPSYPPPLRCKAGTIQEILLLQVPSSLPGYRQVRIYKGQVRIYIKVFGLKATLSEEQVRIYKHTPCPSCGNTMHSPRRSQAVVTEYASWQGKNEEADLLFSRAIEIGEKNLGCDHPNMILMLNNTAQ